MKLSSFDDQCVRITTKSGEVFEGACRWYSADMNEAEYGKEEEGLEIAGWLFDRIDIASVERITPDNPYRALFGVIEETAVCEGADAVEDILYSEEPRNAERLLLCLKHQLMQPDNDALPDKYLLKAAMEGALLFPGNAPVFELLRELIVLLPDHNESDT